MTSDVVVKCPQETQVIENCPKMRRIRVVMMAPISPNQSERSKFGLDQSESRISPM